ncbi:MAG TPA: hypothetical protein ENK18_03640 [Deltaproteobacteria bacterium]|nr:hypothetical protein [Deltaproteobacteria bacterium]
MRTEFCSPFDHDLAHRGPPAVFLLDREGLLRFDPQWTRDAWGRSPGPHEPGWVWILARDRDTGFVWQVLATSPQLLPDHPRLDLRAFVDRAGAVALLASLGEPPLAREPW